MRHEGFEFSSKRVALDPVDHVAAVRGASGDTVGGVDVGESAVGGVDVFPTQDEIVVGVTTLPGISIKMIRLDGYEPSYFGWRR